MKKYIVTLLLSISTFSTTLTAQEGWTLRQCIDYAIENNINIRQAENSVEQYKVDVNTTKWARLPNLNASAGQGLNWGRTSTPIKNEETGDYTQVFVNTNSNNTSFSVGTNIPLFTGLELPNRYSLAKINLNAAVADLDKAKDDIAINIASVYLQVLFNQELNKIADEQLTLSKEQLQRIIRLNEVGKVSPAEVAETRARVAQDEMSVVQTENNYQLALLDLSQLLELPSPEGFALTSPKEEPYFEPLTPPGEIFLQASNERPGILAAGYRLEGSQKNIRIAQSAYYPQLSFSGSLGTGYYSTVANRNFGQQMSDNFNKYLGFSLSIPIFNRFSTRNRVRTAKLQQIDFSLRLENSKKELYKEIQQAWYSALAAESKYKTSSIAVEANEEAFRLMTEKFENGKSTSLEFNEAKLNLTKSLSDQIQAKYEYIFRTKILDFYKGKPIE